MTNLRRMDRRADGPGRRLARVAAASGQRRAGLVARLAGNRHVRLLHPGSYRPGALDVLQSRRSALGKRLLRAISRSGRLAAASGPSLRRAGDVGAGRRLARGMIFRRTYRAGANCSSGLSSVWGWCAGLEPHRRPFALGPKQLLGHAGPHRVPPAAVAGRWAALRVGGGRIGFRPSHAHPLLGLARGGVFRCLWALAMGERQAGAANGLRTGATKGDSPIF